MPRAGEALVTSLGLVLCASAALHTSPGLLAEERPRPATASSGRTRAVTLLSPRVLEACRDPRAAIVLARVDSARISNAGTRSEMTILDLTLERRICGEAPATLRAWRYTSGGDTVLRKGGRYVLACARGSGPVDWGLGEFVAVPAGKESEIVDAHLAALKRAGAGK